MTAAVLDVEIGGGLPASLATGGYGAAWVLLRLDGTPIGSVRVACPGGVVTHRALELAIRSRPEVGERLGRALATGLLRPVEGGSQPDGSTRPSFTVVVCTRHRPDSLRNCLKALGKVRLDGGSVLVVDNGAGDDGVRELVAESGFEYLHHPAPGLNRARRAAAQAARGEILVFVDDDATVDPHWLDAMLAPFEEPRVGVVTGQAAPLELATEAQELFERYCSFSRGFEPLVFDWSVMPPAAAGRVGAGVTMAVRASLVHRLGLFDAELDAGTPARSGGDHYAFYLVLAAGHKIVYRPDALVWHRHRPGYDAMKDTVAGYSVGLYTLLTRCLVLHRDLQALRVGWSWFRSHHLHELLRSLLRRPGSAPRDLVVAEMRGALSAPAVFLRTRASERRRGGA